MIREFLKHSFTYGLGTFLTRGTSFLLLPLYTRALTPYDYGIISYLSSLLVFSLPLITLEIIQGMGIHYAETKTDEERSSYISSAFIFLIFMSFLFIVISLCFKQEITTVLLGATLNSNIVLMAVLAIIVNGLFLYLQSQLLWQLKSLTYSTISLINAFVTIFATVMLVLVFKTGIIGVFTARVAGYLSGAIVAWFKLRKYIKLTFNVQKIKALLSYSLPLVPANIGYYAFLYVDQLAVKHFLGLQQAGIYGVSCRFAVIAHLLVSTIGSALVPLIYRHSEQPRTKIQLERIFRLVLLAIFAIFIGSILFSGLLVRVFATSAYMSATPLIPLLVIAAFLANMHIFLPGLALRKKTKVIAVIYMFGGVLNLLANFIFIPFMGLIGACLATLLSSFLVFCTYLYFNQRYYPIKFHGIKIMFSCLIVWLFYFFCTFFFGKNSMSFSFSSIAWKFLLLFSMMLAFIPLLFSKAERGMLKLFRLKKIFRYSFQSQSYK
jgi:O-antigen/teichoic acid export membrane protein